MHHHREHMTPAIRIGILGTGNIAALYMCAIDAIYDKAGLGRRSS